MHYQTKRIARQSIIMLAAFCFSFWGLSSAEERQEALPTSAEKLAQILSKIQVRLEEARLSLKFPGASVGFVLPDGRSAAASTGLADLETKTLLKPSDRLLAGSIGKTFVAAEVLLLAQEGKLGLDDKIERWLGQEKWFAQLPNGHDLSLRMLLNHSSGIQNHVDDRRFIKTDIKNSTRDIRYEELLAYVLNKKPLFAAGKGFNYSDTNYIIVGLIVERVTGNTLYDEITRRILKPLRLERTIPSNSRVLPEVANGYYQNNPMIIGGKFTINPQWEWAGGGFASTTEDLARWAKALYEEKVVKPEFLAEMLHSTTTGEGAGYGLGVEIVPSKFGKAYGHDGEFPGYLSDLRYFPQYQIAVAVQVNFDGIKEAEQFMKTAVDDFAQIIIGELSARRLSAADQSSLQELTESWLKLLGEGKYAVSWEGISTELKAKYTQEKWAFALQPLVRQAGSLKARKLKSIVYADPQAETVAVEFESSFAKSPAVTEIVSLKLEKDGKWRISGYTLK